MSTVLIVDDDPLFVNAFARLCRIEGLDCVTDITASRVTEFAVRYHPGLIVLDVNQAVDGRDLLAQLKRNPETAHIPVIMLSGLEDQYLRHTCLELGAEDYALKPLDEAFMRRLARRLKQPELPTA